MNITTITEDIILSGLTIRTKNSNEMLPSTAKIGPVWEKFFNEVAPSLQKDSKLYGVYSNYESDASGEFDVTVCTNEKIAQLNTITLKKGKYLIFSAKGKMPEVVIETWKEIWNFFSAENNKFQRSYFTDFEYYKNGEEIEIYIGIID